MVRAYSNIPIKIADYLQNVPVPSTGAFLTCTSGDGTLTYISHRVTEWQRIIEKLPCIHIDIDEQAIEYERSDQGHFRLIPVSIMVYIPIQDTDLETAAQRDQEDLRADIDIKTVFEHIEELINATTASRSIANTTLEMQSGGIVFDPVSGNDESLGISVRMAVMLITARQQILP